MLHITIEQNEKNFKLPSLSETDPPGSMTDLSNNQEEIVVFGYFNDKCGVWVSKDGLTIEKGKHIRELMTFNFQEEKIINKGEKYTRKLETKKGIIFLILERE